MGLRLLHEAEGLLAQLVEDGFGGFLIAADGLEDVFGVDKRVHHGDRAAHFDHHMLAFVGKDPAGFQQLRDASLGEVDFGKVQDLCHGLGDVAAATGAGVLVAQVHDAA